MKQQFYGFILISSAIIISVLTSAVVVKMTRNDIVLSEPVKINNFNCLLENFTKFNLNDAEFSSQDFNNSYTMNELVTINTTATYTGSIASLGSIRNGTGHNHGVIQLFTFTDDYYSATSYDSVVYKDVQSKETNYINGKVIKTSFNNTNTNPMLIAIKEFDSIYRFIDFFTVTSSSLTLAYSYNISSSVLNETYAFDIFDIDQDNIYELYVIGKNSTDLSQNTVIELTYNSIANDYEISTSFNWDGTDHIVIDVETIAETDDVNFIITGVNVPTVESYLEAITINKGVTRNFVFIDSLTINYGVDDFRVYGMKLYKSKSLANDGIVLFGSYIYAISGTEPSCITTSFSSGNFGTIQLSIMNQTPSWSLDGQVVDLDLDGQDEIIAISYDLFNVDVSKYTILVGDDMAQTDTYSSDLKQISSSTTLKLFDIQISSSLGKNNLNNPSIEFYLAQHLAFNVRGNAEVLLENSENELYIQPTDLVGNNVSRSDLTIQAKVDSNLDINYTIAELPGNVTLNVNEITTTIENEQIEFTVLQNSRIIRKYELIIDVDFKPEIELVLQPSPITIRRVDSISHIIELTFNNRLSRDLQVKVNIYSAYIDQGVSYFYNFSSDSTTTKELSIVFIGFTPKSKYTEEVTITLVTGAGTYQFSTLYKVTNKFHLTSNDLFVTLWVAIALVLVLYIVFGLQMYKRTEQKLDRYFAGKGTADLEFKALRKRALSSLLEKYISQGNWKSGLKLASEHVPRYTQQFHKFKARDQLKMGQKSINEAKFEDGLILWQEAKESLEIIAVHELIDILDWLIKPLERIIDIKGTMKGSEKANALQKEFHNLSGMKEQQKVIYNIQLDIPLYIIAEELGLAFRDTKELQSSLNYLQLAYQEAPDEIKNCIVNEITSLISLGVTPSEMSLPVDQEAIMERISKRTTKCFSCGEERTNFQEACPNCGVDTILCSVCKLPISFGSEYLECYHCENIAHKEHLLEWVKVKGTCPICQQKLIPDKLSVVEKKD